MTIIITEKSNILVDLLMMLPISGIFILIIPVKTTAKDLKCITINVTLQIFIVTLIIIITFDSTNPTFQFKNLYNFSSIFPSIKLGIDGISLIFLVLTTYIFPLIIFFTNTNNHKDNLKNTSKIRFYYLKFLIIELVIIITFITTNIFYFYIFFEIVLIPIYFLIGFLGSGVRKTRANYILFLYTLIGSFFILFAILYIYKITGTTCYETIIKHNFNFKEQIYLWICFYIAFITKIPIAPAHIWLPEAHVEAPTEGSVILASLLLKLGGYGFIRYNLSIFINASIYFKPYVATISTIIVIYASLIALRQIDFKRVIAYSSIAHINIIVAGLFSFSHCSIVGSIYQIISHGLVSAGLFFCCGVLYNKYHTRLIKNYTGLKQTIPIFSSLLLFFTFSNIAFPGTSSFVGEILILIGLFKSNPIICFFTASSLIFSASYSLWIYNRIMCGNIDSKYTLFSKETNNKEFIVLFILSITILFIGLLPNFILEPLNFSIAFSLKNIIN